MAAALMAMIIPLLVSLSSMSILAVWSRATEWLSRNCQRTDCDAVVKLMVDDGPKITNYLRQGGGDRRVDRENTILGDLGLLLHDLDR